MAIIAYEQITPERILYYFENISYFFGENGEDFETFDKDIKSGFFKEFYMFSHIGTKNLHLCQHPQWEKLFLISESRMIDSGHMLSYKDKLTSNPINSFKKETYEVNTKEVRKNG